MKEKNVVILAAGKGQRMASLDESHSKVAYPILGKPLVNYVLDASKVLEAKNTYVVVGFGGEATINCVKDEAKIVWQHEVNGTGGAVMDVEELKNMKGDVIILCGDTPLLTKETLFKIYHKHEKQENDLTICSTVLANPTGYGRVIRERPSYRIKEVRPYAEISEEEMEINEVNSGIYVVNNELLQKYLPKLSRENKKNEYYLSDIVGLFVKDGLKVDAYVLEDAVDMFNINDRVQLAYAAKVIRRRINHNLMLSGVSIEDPETTYISQDAIIGKDAVILPNTHILGKCVIGEEAFIGPNTSLTNVRVGKFAKVSYSDLKNVEVKEHEVVGPFESRD